MKLVTADVAAPVIGCRESWLRWAAQHGLVPHYKISRSLRFSIEELEDWCRRQRVPAADEREVETNGDLKSRLRPRAGGK